MFSRDQESHLAHLEPLLTKLRKAGLPSNLKKCFFFQPRVEYFGHVIHPGNLSVANDRVTAFGRFTFPQTLTQLHSFLRVCNMYRLFVKEFTKIARTMSSMLSKEAGPDYENPTEAKVEALEELKKNLLSPRSKRFRT